MNESQRYSTARAFRQALEARLQVRARAAGVDVGRLRKQSCIRLLPDATFPIGIRRGRLGAEGRLCA